jgi:hypothetical protein
MKTFETIKVLKQKHFFALSEDDVRTSCELLVDEMMAQFVGG